MSGGDVLERATEVCAAFIEQGRVRFERGEPRRYFAQMSRISMGFALPLLPREHLVDALVLKNMCSLWNVVVDDEIDRRRTRANLDASLALLAAAGRGSVEPATDAERVLSFMFSRMPAPRAREQAILRFDLSEIAHGFDYEHRINESPFFASKLEYDKYSAMTMSTKTFLDIDCLFLAAPLPGDVYRRIRAGCEHLSLALKYSSDIGTLKREMLQEDNLNIVRIRAAEAGVLALDRRIGGEEYDDVLRALKPIVDEVRAHALASFALAKEVWSQLPGLDMSSWLATAGAIIQPYASGHDPFFDAAG